MYKIYNSILFSIFTYLLLFSSQLAISQSITVESSDMPQRNQIYRLSTGDSILQVDPSLTGPGYSWDFSNLSAVVQQKDSFLSANDVPLTIRFFFPLSLTFPSDNSLVQYIDTPDSLGGVGIGSGFQFYEVKSNVMLGHGLGATVQGIPLALQNTPADTVYRFPMNFGDMDSASSTAEFEFPGVIYYLQNRKRINEVDGWGTITTPYGSFDVLRVKTQVSGRDSVQLDTLQGFAIDVPASTEYKWIAKGEGVPILQINTTTAAQIEVVSTILYRDSARAGVPVVSIEPELRKDIRVYPNPASEFIRIESQQALGQQTQISLYETSGKLVLQQVQTGNGTEITIPVQALPGGIYLLRVTTETGIFLTKIRIDHN